MGASMSIPGGMPPGPTSPPGGAPALAPPPMPDIIFWSSAMSMPERSSSCAMQGDARDSRE